MLRCKDAGDFFFFKILGVKVLPIFFPQMCDSLGTMITPISKFHCEITLCCSNNFVSLLIPVFCLIVILDLYSQTSCTVRSLVFFKFKKYISYNSLHLELQINQNEGQ